MEKREIYSQPKFRQIISLETSLVNTLFLRKFCQKSKFKGPAKSFGYRGLKLLAGI